MRRVRRVAVVLALVTALMMAFAPAGNAQLPFCSSGADFGEFHSTLARAGGVGGEGHKPGVHQGFSVCVAQTGHHP